jgi:four helix bundle protein
MIVNINNEQFRFTSWQVYKDAKSLYGFVHVVLKKLPREYERSIGDQLQRSSLSIVLNIAEGSGKHSDADLHRYLSISMGSLYEVFAIFDVMYENKIITVNEFGEATNMIHNIGNQLGGFKNLLKRKPRASK